ncbi:unnamed protein product [Cyclocybe aegerita]|uniref:Uncharacterized protein n=1 Tax=Cyclocybe aegerita TaxID=1973307 RepID=A0A8S0VT43_CYCAE|nr:unnamed protein product [Cyclocybe aegerita]
MAARLTKNPEVMRFIVRDIVKIYRKDFIVGDGMIDLEKMRLTQVIVYFEPCNWDHAAPKKFAAREGKSMPGSLRLARVQDATLLLSEDMPNPDPLAASVRKVWLQRREEDYPTVVVQFWCQSAIHLTTVKVTPKDVNDFHSLKSELRIFHELKQIVANSMVGGVE